MKTTGDGMLVEFGSVVDALRCAVEVQRGMADRNAEVPGDKRIEFRVGIHQGDIIIDGDDIFGDGVNVAARLEGLTHPGGICVSARVQEDAHGKATRVAHEVGTEGKLGGQARVVAGAKYRPSHHCRREWRPVEEDHGRRAGRNPRLEEHHQQDGGSAQFIRRRSNARGA